MGLLESLRNIEFEPSPMSMGLLQMGAQMLANSSNQPHPIGFGQVLGNGLMGFAQGANDINQQRLMLQKMADEKALKDAQIRHYEALNNKASAGPDPYYQVMETSNGLYRFNARTGQYEPLMEGDKPLMRSTSDPVRQGEISGAKSLNTINKQTLPDGSEVPMFNRDALGYSGMNAMPPSDRQPAQVIVEPNRNIPADVSGLDRDKALAEVSTYPYDHPDRVAIETAFGVRGQQPATRAGIGQSTADKAKVEQSALTQGIIARETAKAEIENQQKIDQSNQKKQNGASNMLELLSSQNAGRGIESLIDEATGSGAGAARDAVFGYFGKSTEAGNAAEQLKTLQGWLVSNVPRMEGPQSDFDVKNYQQMAAAIGDPLLPADRKKAALNGLVSILKKYSGGEKSAATPSTDDLVNHYLKGK